MKKEDVKVAHVFMKREDGSQLVFETDDDKFPLRDSSKLFFTDDFLVINEFPKVRIKYHHIQKISLSYESDFFIEYERLISLVKEAWINNYEAEIYMLYKDMYYYVKKGMLLSSGNNSMTCLLDGEENQVKYSDIDDIRINITFFESKED